MLHVVKKIKKFFLETKEDDYVIFKKRYPKSINPSYP